MCSKAARTGGGLEFQEVDLKLGPLALRRCGKSPRRRSDPLTDATGVRPIVMQLPAKE